MTIKRAIFVGVDPGLTGSVAIIDDTSRPIATIDIVTRHRSVINTHLSREFDVRATADQVIDRLVNYLECKWYGLIEMPFIMRGVKTNVLTVSSQYQTYGGLLAMMDMLEIETTSIQPSTWKKGFGLTKSKMLSIDIARQLWPTIDLSLKKHHDTAEALLIAEYRRLQWKQEHQYNDR